LAPDKTTLRLLSRQLSKLDAHSQVQVLGLIADRGDLSSIKFVLPLLGQASSPVQVAAVKALTKTGNAAAAQALLAAAVSEDRAVQKAARQGLTLMVGPNVEDVIVAQAMAGETPLRSEAISAMGTRTMTASVPLLLVFAQERAVARAACQALASVASEKDIKALATLVVSAPDNGIRNDAVTTLKAVLTTAERQEEAAQVVIDQMSDAPQQGKLALVKSLNALGGSTQALEYVITATESSNEALKDAAVRTLGDWPDYGAAEVLVAIAADKDASMIHHVVATRGALRLIQAAGSVPAESRVTLCIKALDQTRRVEEKRQAITVLGTLPVKAAADQLLALTKDQSVRSEAALATLVLASRLRSKDRDVSKALAQPIRDMDISSAVNRNADRIIQGRR
jgi:HEAT repeat protein